MTDKHIDFKDCEFVGADTRSELEEEIAKLRAEKSALSMQLDGARGCLKETEARVVKLQRALQGAIDMLEPVGHDDDTPEQAKIDWKNDLISLRKVLEATQ